MGGGLAGASLALLLSHHLPQLKITLIESFPLFNSDNEKSLPSYDDRSSALSLGSCRILQTLTIWSQLKPYLTAIEKVHVSDRGHPAGTLLDYRELDDISDEEALGYVVENRHLGQVLLSALAQQSNIDTISPATVAEVTPQADEAQLVIRQGDKQQRLAANLIVIADGAHSSLREKLGIAVEKSDYGQVAVIANITSSGYHDGVAYERFTDSGPMALLPLGDFNDEHRSALVWTVDSDREADVVAMSDEAFLQTIQQRFGNRLGFFTRVGKRHIYPLALYKAKEQIRRHIVLMGNAAHAMHPVAGQGFNLALRDCSALVDTLCDATVRGQSPGELDVLNHYLSRQDLDQEKTIGTSHLLTLLFSTAETLPAFARNTGLFGLNFLPGIKAWFARQAMGVAGNRSQIAQPASSTAAEKRIK